MRNKQATYLSVCDSRASVPHAHSLTKVAMLLLSYMALNGLHSAYVPYKKLLTHSRMVLLFRSRHLWNVHQRLTFTSVYYNSKLLSIKSCRQSLQQVTEIEQEQKLLNAQRELHQRKAEVARESLHTATDNCQQCDTYIVLWLLFSC